MCRPPLCMLREYRASRGAVLPCGDVCRASLMTQIRYVEKRGWRTGTAPLCDARQRRVPSAFCSARRDETKALTDRPGTMLAVPALLVLALALAPSGGPRAGICLGEDGTNVLPWDFEGDGLTHAEKCVSSSTSIWYMQSGSADSWHGVYRGSESYGIAHQGLLDPGSWSALTSNGRS
jgi:hypothetical protein